MGWFRKSSGLSKFEVIGFINNDLAILTNLSLQRKNRLTGNLLSDPNVEEWYKKHLEICTMIASMTMSSGTELDHMTLFIMSFSAIAKFNNLEEYRLDDPNLGDIVRLELLQKVTHIGKPSLAGLSKVTLDFLERLDF